MREAAYFSTENGQTCRKTDTFGLIGLHIIQRTHAAVPEGTKTTKAKHMVITDPENCTFDPKTGKPNPKNCKLQPYTVDQTLSAKAVGGAFVFATWEHRAIFPDDTKPSLDYVYANFFPGVIETEAGASAKEDGKPENGKPEDGKPEDGKPEDRALSSHTTRGGGLLLGVTARRLMRPLYWKALFLP